MNFLRIPDGSPLSSDPEKFEQVQELVGVIQSEKKSGFGWRILQAFTNILGIHGKVSESQKMADFIRNNPLPPNQS